MCRSRQNKNYCMNEHLHFQYKKFLLFFVKAFSCLNITIKLNYNDYFCTNICFLSVVPNYDDDDDDENFPFFCHHNFNFVF